MQIITTMADVRTYIANTNPGNVLIDADLAEDLAEAMRTADGRPAWGEDWEEWLNENAERLVAELPAS